jgi:hypothetical protein
VDQSGHNRDGLNQRRPGFAGIAKIPKNLVRIVSSHSRSPAGGELSDDLSPPQETLSKISIPASQKQSANAINLYARSTRSKSNLGQDTQSSGQDADSSRKPPVGSSSNVGERQRAKAPQKRKSPRVIQEESHLESSANVSSLGGGGLATSGSIILDGTASEEQRLQQVNVSKPVVPLKSINFLNFNARNARGHHHERSPGDQDSIQSLAHGQDQSTSSIGAPKAVSHLQVTDHQYKER